MSIHHESHFKDSLALRDIVIGMSDGLTVPFALAAGLSGASLSNRVIVTAGVAELVAGSIAMGLGGYLAGKSAVEHYRGELKREIHEIETLPEEEKREIREILGNYGISQATQVTFVDELAQNKSHWLSFMMEFELGLQKPDESQATWGALRIGISYAVGGLVPLSAYVMTPTPHQGLIISTGLTLLALGIFGDTKSRFLGQPRLQGALRTIFIGALAAASAYFIARAVS